MPSVESEFCSPVEVAKSLSVSRYAILAAVRRGDIPSCRVGKLVRIPRSYVTNAAQPKAESIPVSANDAGLALTNLLASLRGKYAEALALLDETEAALRSDEIAS